MGGTRISELFQDKTLEDVTLKQYLYCRYISHSYIDPIGSDANDTVTGDPVMKVPIRVPQEQLASISANRLSLCYEVHGAANEWFNLISDQCASVNAHYSPVNENLNVVDKIGIRAVDDDGKCVNIMLNSENCSFDIDGISAPYNSKGIKVRKYLNHIRISVPNCDELRLTMWSICIHREYNGGMDHADLLELVVVRGLNYGHRKAHGLIGEKGHGVHVCLGREGRSPGHLYPNQ